MELDAKIYPGKQNENKVRVSSRSEHSIINQIIFVHQQ